MVSFSLYGWSFLFWSSHIGYIVRDNRCNWYFANFLLRCHSQVATIFTFVWDFSVKLLFGRRHRAISYLNTLSNFTPSWYTTELFPILIHYRTILYLTRLPNSSLSSYITELCPILIHWAEPYPNILHYRTIPTLIHFWSIPYLNTLSNYTLS